MTYKHKACHQTLSFRQAFHTNTLKLVSQLCASDSLGPSNGSLPLAFHTEIQLPLLELTVCTTNTWAVFFLKTYFVCMDVLPASMSEQMYMPGALGD